MIAASHVLSQMVVGVLAFQAMWFASYHERDKANHAIETTSIQAVVTGAASDEQ